MKGWREGGGEARVRALSGELRDVFKVDRINGDLYMLLKFIKLIKSRFIFLLGEGRKRKLEML